MRLLLNFEHRVLRSVGRVIVLASVSEIITRLKKCPK
jgi:hypothetical protein